jgi:transposase
MGKSYSLDLRERIFAEIDGGSTHRSAAIVFGVSPSSVVRLVQRQQATGSLAPAPQGRPRGSGKLAAHVEFLVAEVKARPDITMPELAALLQAEKGVTAHPSSLSRVLCAAGLTFKKNTAGDGKRTFRR